jgi:hypothetical protein
VSIWGRVATRFEDESKLQLYKEDPSAWAKDKLGAHLWSKQRGIMASLVSNRRTAVRSCHDSGKSFVAGLAASWWIDSHPHGEAFVASTAPTSAQIRGILWEEIRKNHRRGKLPGKVLLSDEWKLDDGTLVGWGRKPSDTDETGFQGIHRRYVLVIIDEACGVPEQLWTAVEAITTNADARILAIGNPDDPNTHFAKVCQPGSGWNVIKISAFDTPNFTEEPVPPELHPMLVSREWVEDARKRWGEDSPLYISKVLGEFPESSQNTLIPVSWILAAQRRWLEPSGYAIFGVDVARFGSDRSILYLRRGDHVRLLRDWQHAATTESAGVVVAAAREHLPSEIRVDGAGVGGGVVDQLAEMGMPVVDMQAGARAVDSEHYLNARAEWFWRLRERFESGEIDIDPADDVLASQLAALQYRYTSRGQIQIESKDDMRKRGMPSPDRADALCLAFADLAVVDRIIEFADTWSADLEFQFLRERGLHPLAALLDIRDRGVGGSALDGAV